LRAHPDIGGRAAAEYLSDGRDHAIKLPTLIEEQRPISSVRILEFAPAYGRVIRHLPKIIPEATITACDIDAEAVRFIVRLGVDAILSCEDPDDFNSARRFDIASGLDFMYRYEESGHLFQERRSDTVAGSCGFYCDAGPLGCCIEMGGLNVGWRCREDNCLNKRRPCRHSCYARPGSAATGLPTQRL
jgi:hypothetical protein